MTYSNKTIAVIQEIRQHGTHSSIYGPFERTYTLPDLHQEFDNYHDVKRLCNNRFLSEFENKIKSGEITKETTHWLDGVEKPIYVDYVEVT